MGADLTIFVVLMKIFRSHIARISSFFILILGMVLHFTKPIEENAGKDAFAFWLESHLKTQNSAVIDQIEALTNDSEELETIIRKASELILSHSDDFELPVSKRDSDSSKEDLYQLLLTEWNSYQNSTSGMGTAVFIQNIKPQTILPSDSPFNSTAITKASQHFDVDQITDINSHELSRSNSHFLSPLKSGTAIGAP